LQSGGILPRLGYFNHRRRCPKCRFLTPRFARHKLSAKPARFFDGGGLYPLVSPTGAKLWRFKSRFDGKEKLLAFGAYPHLTLAAVRKRRDDVRNPLADGKG